MISPKEFFDPCAWVWFGLLAAAIWNFRRRAWKPVLLLAGLAMLLSLVETLRVPERLLASKERRYWLAPDPAAQPQAFAGAQAVVMCGGVLNVSPRDFTGANYTDAVDRFLKAVELAKLFRQPLVLGGGLSGGAGTPLESVFERKWLAEWGQTNLQVLELGLCENTHDEALSAAKIARDHGWKKIVLVTSAYHLDRALAVFRHTGLQVIPVGCDFHAVPALTRKAGLKILPTTDSAENLRLYLTESVGLIYYRLRGWIG
jgi:uncharacterized SAM-binding protein YcdF (DUF218 family)